METIITTTRRGWLHLAAASAFAGVAGCGGAPRDGAGEGGGDGADPAEADSDVVAGPDGRLVFDPETITVSTGDAVRWYFDSPRHNVSCRPGDSRLVELPDGAEPFASYPADASPGSVVAVGETYEHAFAVPGTYVYACIPHQGSGMIGRVEVE